MKIRKIIILLKYSQEYARQLKAQNEANKIIGAQKVNLDKGVRWNSTCESRIYYLLFLLLAFSPFFDFYFIYFQ